jgi:hypothetical protein
VGVGSRGHERGHRPPRRDILTMIRHVKAAKALVNVAGTVETEFLDDQA